MSRKKLLVGNWKMHGTVSSVQALVEAVVESSYTTQPFETVVCPPFVYLSLVNDRLKNGVKLGAQTASMFNNGAYTGDVSAQMLKEQGCDYVIVGHSERRQFFSETDEVVLAKTQRVLHAGLTPIVCIGESLSQRDSGNAWKTVEAQMLMVMSGLGDDELASVVWAYEPVWAIGTGRSATSAQAQEMHSLVRHVLVNRGAGDQPVLYGGSLKPENARELFACDHIDGGLVGGASLDAESFKSIGQALIGN